MGFEQWGLSSKLKAHRSRLKQRPPQPAEAFVGFGSAYFAAVSLAVFGFPASGLLNLRRKRSTRPAVAISFCFPVKNGGQGGQILTTISPFCVEGGSKV